LTKALGKKSAVFTSEEKVSIKPYKDNPDLYSDIQKSDIAGEKQFLALHNKTLAKKIATEYISSLNKNNLINPDFFAAQMLTINDAGKKLSALPKIGKKTGSTKAASADAASSYAASSDAASSDASSSDTSSADESDTDTKTHQRIVFDEAQGLTPSQIASLLFVLGLFPGQDPNGSKLFILGDGDQNFKRSI
jgi:hypothetical protein